MAKLHKRKSGMYALLYRGGDGKRKWKSTGTKSEEEAENMLRAVNRLENSRRRRELLVEIVADMGTDTEGVLVPIRDAERMFLETEQRASDRSRARKIAALKKFTGWLNSKHPQIVYVSEITEQIAAEYWQYLTTEGINPATQNRHLSGLRTIFAAIRIPAGLGKNVWGAIRRNREEPIRYEALTFEQVQQLYHLAREMDTKLDRTWWPGAIAMGFLTGLRQGDIAKLKVGEVSAGSQFVELTPSKTAKWGKGQLVHPASVDFLQWMNLDKPAGAYVWPKAAEDKNVAGGGILGAEWSRLCKTAGIKHSRRPRPGEHRQRRVKLVPFHSLRHTFVTLAIDRGADERDVQRAVGHANRQMTERYNHSKCLAATQRIADLMPRLS